MLVLLLATFAMARSELEITADRSVVVKAGGEMGEVFGGSSSFNLKLDDGQAGRIPVRIELRTGEVLIDTYITVPEGRKVVYLYQMKRLNLRSDRDIDYKRPTINAAQRRALGGGSARTPSPKIKPKSEPAPVRRRTDPFLDVLQEIREGDDKPSVARLTIRTIGQTSISFRGETVQVQGDYTFDGVPFGTASLMVNGARLSVEVSSAQTTAELRNGALVVLP